MVPERAPPIASRGVIGWLRANLFSNYLSAALTIASIAILALIVPGLIDWAFIDATLTGELGKDCPSEGACWAWLDQRITQFFYGFYPAGGLLAREHLHRPAGAGACLRAVRQAALLPATGAGSRSPIR